MTDVLANCEVSIAPRDFEALLAGYNYQRQAMNGSQVSLSAGVRDFEATDVYIAEPKEFVHGGSVMVYVNARRDLAIVDLYIE